MSLENCVKGKSREGLKS